MEEAFRLVFGPYPFAFAAKIPLPTLRFGYTVIAGIHLLILIVGLLVLALTWFALRRTRLGLFWRATSQDMATAEAIGINTRGVVAAIFIIGYALAAVSGVLLGINYDTVYPTMGDIPAYKMLAIIVLGGLGNPIGTIAAAMLIGLVGDIHRNVRELRPASRRDSVHRPHRHSARAAAGASARGPGRRDELPDRRRRDDRHLRDALRRPRHGRRLCRPAQCSPESAFLGLGAYFAAVLSTRCHVGFWWTIPVSFGAASVAGLSSAPSASDCTRLPRHHDHRPQLRRGGDIPVHPLFRGEQCGIYAIPVPAIGTHKFGNLDYLVVAALMLTLVVGVSKYLEKTWLGASLGAIRDDESAAASVGVPVDLLQGRSLHAQRRLRGHGRKLYAPFLSAVTPTSFGFTESVVIL